MLLTRLLVIIVLCATVAVGDDKKQEGAALVSHAVEISNIRADQATPFTLVATFRVVGKDPEEAGTYSETWISGDKWHREITLGNFHWLEVANGHKKWVIDQDQNPRYFNGLANALQMSGPPREIKVKELDSKQLDGTQTDCVRLEETTLKQVYCIDHEHATLLRSESIFTMGTGPHVLVGYSDYQKFGDHLFPQDIAYRDFAGETLVIAVSKLSADVSSDPSLFAAPAGAQELGNCPLDKTNHPVSEFSPDPEFPNAEKSKSSVVILSTIVGTDGKPHLVRVARSGGGDFDAAAIRALQTWKFRPATCQGEPMATKINVEITFNRGSTP